MSAINYSLWLRCKRLWHSLFHEYIQKFIQLNLLNLNVYISTLLIYIFHILYEVIFKVFKYALMINFTNSVIHKFIIVDQIQVVTWYFHIIIIFFFIIRFSEEKKQLILVNTYYVKVCMNYIMYNKEL